MRFPEPALSLPNPTHQTPTQIIAGDSIDFLVSIPGGYETWAGSARLTGPQTMDATSCATEGNDFHVYFQGQGAAGTQNLGDGQYVVSIFATNGNDRKLVKQIPFSITADLKTIDAPVLSHAVKMLEQIEAVLEYRMTGRKSGPLESYTIDGRTLQDMPTTELYALRARYASEVASQQNPDKPIGSVKFSFPAPLVGPGPWPLGDARLWLR